MTARWRYLSPHPWTIEYSEIFTMPQDMKDLLFTKFFSTLMAKEPEQISCQESENEFEDDFFSDKVIASLEFTNTHIIVVERLSKYTSGFDSFFFIVAFNGEERKISWRWVRIKVDRPVDDTKTTTLNFKMCIKVLCRLEFFGYRPNALTSSLSSASTIFCSLLEHTPVKWEKCRRRVWFCLSDDESSCRAESTSFSPCWVIATHAIFLGKQDLPLKRYLS